MDENKLLERIRFNPKIFGGKPERATATLDEIGAAGFFEVVEAKRPGRAATYRRAAHA